MKFNFNNNKYKIEYKNNFIVKKMNDKFGNYEEVFALKTTVIWGWSLLFLLIIYFICKIIF